MFYMYYLINLTTLPFGLIVTPILEMWELRHRDIQQLAQGHLPCSLSPLTLFL